MYPKILLKPGKERSVKNYHPWIFSGAVKNTDKGINDGDIVDILSADGQLLGRAFYNNGSIIARIFSFSGEDISPGFWGKKLRNAFDVRKNIGLAGNPLNNVYRLFHGEGDGIPGLIIDIYKDIAVIQAHNPGIYSFKDQVKDALLDLYGPALQTVYDKSSETLPKIAGLNATDGFLYGASAFTTVTEHGCIFEVDIPSGQKTGYFIDQRENRKLLGELSKGKAVLNTFCYSGGFSVYALKAGASFVHSVDSSKKAIELTDKNIGLNGFSENHTSFATDVFDFLKKEEVRNRYDIIVLDPPAFAKHQSAIPNASRGYQRINQQAIEKIRAGGLLFTFSCSQAIGKDLFRKIVFSAAAQTGRTVRILYQLSQPADHPVNIYHPEGEYLKGLVLHIE